MGMMCLSFLLEVITAPTLHTSVVDVLCILCSSDPAHSSLSPPSWSAHVYGFVLWSSAFTHQKFCSSFSDFKALPTLFSVPKLFKFSLPWVLPALGKGGLSDLQVTDRSSSSCTSVIAFRCQK